MESPPRRRLPVGLMLLVATLLLAALWAGLLRLGWRLPSWSAGLPQAHGPLMVSGFLGALISLERAVALRRPWAYSGPALSGLGGVALLVGAPTWIAPGLILLGNVVFLAASVVIIRQAPARHTLVMGLGALAWLGGNSLWLAGRPLFQASYWWAGFLVLVIAGERLELSRILRPSPWAQRLFELAVAALTAGLTLSLWRYAWGIRLASAGVLGLALWLLRYDIARRTRRQTGLTRYIALNLLAGYVWLGVSGVLGLYFGVLAAGPFYDAWLHTLFVGFVFGMIFAHALIILPAVVGIVMPYHTGFYLPPLLLHLSLVLRTAGDLALAPGLRQWGGLLNVIAILLFILLLVGSAWGRRWKTAHDATPSPET